MTSNFNEYHRSDSSPVQGQEENSTHRINQGTQTTQMALNEEKRDRFELLSAYLDGEVTADEKRQIETLLTSDPAMQRLHTRLLSLRTSFRSLPVPPPAQPVEQTVQQVFARIERRPRRALVWGGMAVAALFLGAMASVLPRSEFVPSIAQAPEETTVPDQGLMVALDRPVIEIPTKAAVSAPNPPAKPNQSPAVPAGSVQ